MTYIPNVDDVYGKSFFEDVKEVLSFLAEIAKDALSFEGFKPVSMPSFNVWDKLNSFFAADVDEHEETPQTKKAVSIDWSKMAKMPKQAVETFAKSETAKVTKDVGGIFGAAFGEAFKGLSGIGQLGIGSVKKLWKRLFQK